MAAAVVLRSDYTAAQIRALAKASRHADQTRRLLAVAEIYDGRSRTEAARVGGVGLQTLRDWVLAFNTLGPDGLLRGKAPGQPVDPEGHASPGTGGDAGEGTGPNCAWDRAMAAGGSDAMAV